MHNILRAGHLQSIRPVVIKRYQIYHIIAHVVSADCRDLCSLVTELKCEKTKRANRNWDKVHLSYDISAVQARKNIEHLLLEGKPGPNQYCSTSEESDTSTLRAHWCSYLGSLICVCETGTPVACRGSLPMLNQSHGGVSLDSWQPLPLEVICG